MQPEETHNGSRGKVWLITGCSSGFGRALALAVLAKGERAVVAARRVDRLSDLLAHGADRVIAVPLDVTSQESVDQALAAARERFGRIDVLVNNAGYGEIGTVEETPLVVAHALMETNYYGALAMVQAVIGEMRERGSGQIINIGSIAGQIGFPALAYYCASKAALAALSEALAAELQPLGISVTLAELGPFATDFTQTMKVTAPGAQYDMAALTRQAGNASWGAGDDPALGAAALLAALDDANPPIRLVLGESGLVVAALHEGRRVVERERWRDVSMLKGFTDV